VKKKYHLPAKYVLSLGTQEPRKNLKRLIEACADLPYPLVLTGKHGWGDKVEKPEHVMSLGYVDEVDLPGLYSGASVFCFPSLYEGFGFPVLEAMACGTPVVTSNISSLPEVGGEAAILIDPERVESIRQGILQADKERVTRIKAGLLQAQKFSWEKTAQQVLEVYEQVA
jgi:glycosyltransferase involved in cell wall biosynthesis